MDNKDISTIFLRVADILEIKDDNIFRIRAYRTAAQNISNMPRQLSDIYAEDPAMPDKIPGIGKDLKGKIIEMITTGGLKYYDELVDELPVAFLDMLDLAGLGPKKLKKLKDELGIENIDDLEKACTDGKLENLEGMGKKTQEKLLESIGHFRQREGRMLLPEADAYANDVIDYLMKSKDFKKVRKAGSLRRGKETVGDLDILAVCKDNDKAMDRFVNYPYVENVVAKGTTKSSISLKSGPQVDLRVIDAACFGAALIYFTGSKQHNVKIRKIAKRRKYKISEYGVFDVGTFGKEKFVAGATEEEVYRKLGMEWIPPELREDQGEVEAAAEGKLPKDLIEIEHIKGDMHMHTDETDGSDTLEDMVRQAVKKGYKYVAITNHSQNVRIANGMDEKRLLKHLEEVKRLNKKVKGIKVFAGIEVDILGDGKLDISDNVLKELDVVIAAVHSHFSIEKDKQTARILKAMDNKYVNILAHPSGRLITTRSAIQVDFDSIFRKAAENNIFLEINTHGERIDLNAQNCRRARELGASFVINTDSHSTEQLDGMYYGVVTARRGGIEKKDVLNTYTADKIIKMLSA